MIDNWGRVLTCAAAAGTAFLAWKKLGTSTRDELRLRASCAAGVLLGNPAAYRVTVLKSGDGPGIAVSTGPSVVSQCTVVGVQGNGFSMSWPSSEPLFPGAGEDDEDECEGGEEEDQDMSDETEPVPNVVPAVCVEWHVSYPATFIRVHDSSVYTARTPTQVGLCPECGKQRAVIPGEYRAGTDGFVARTELPA